MAFRIQKPSAVDPNITVYYVKKSHWSDDYNDRKTWATITSPTNLMVNPDGKNGGWEGASIVQE
jgi:hypothetical protein